MIKGSFELMKQLNISVVLKAVIGNGALSRADIAKITGLTPATITNITKELMERGYLVQSRIGESSGGRPPIILELDPNARYIIGVSIGVGKIEVVISNIIAEILIKKSVDLENQDRNKDNVLSIIVNLVNEIIDESGIHKEKIIGVGIAMHGIVNSYTGISEYSPYYGWRNIDIKKELSEKIEYAFNDKIGYLTCLPVNAGTGLKATVVIHLPILSLQKKIETYSNIAHKLGANIKGISSNKSNTLGNMFEITNQSVIGRSEKNIIESLKSLTKDIKTKENESRLLVNMEASIELEDDIYRSLGILQNCRIISAQEAMKHLSNIKLGIEMDYIKDISLEKVINLMTGMKPIMELMSPMTSDGDIKRADFLREEFTLANRNKK